MRADVIPNDPSEQELNHPDDGWVFVCLANTRGGISKSDRPLVPRLGAIPSQGFEPTPVQFKTRSLQMLLLIPTMLGSLLAGVAL
jgi:hypothetical protein